MRPIALMNLSEAKSTSSNASGETRLREVRQILKSEGPAKAERATIEILKDEPKSGPAFMGLALIRPCKSGSTTRCAQQKKRRPFPH